MTEHQKQFKAFWEIYPKRNGKRPGRDFAEIWFEAKKPDAERFEKMMYYLKTDIANRNYNTKKGEFYAAPQDVKVFLKNWSPNDEIEPLTGAVKKANVCATCGKPASGFNKGKWHCPDHNPYGRVKFIKPSLHRNVNVDSVTPKERIREESGDTNNGVSDDLAYDKAEAGSVSASNTRICGMCKMGRAKHQTTVDFITMNVCDKCYSLSKESGETSAPSKEDYKTRIEQATKGFFEGKQANL